MQLRKISENISRSFDAEGNMTERTDSAQYEIIGNDGQSVGSASIGQGWANANVTINGHQTIAEGEEQIKQMLGIED